MAPRTMSFDDANAILARQPAQGGARQPAMSFDEVSARLESLNRALPAQAPEPRTLTLDEATRLMQARQSGLPVVGQMVRELPENLRNPVASTLTTMVHAPLGVFDLPHLAARGVDWSTDQLNRLAGIPETSREYRTNLAPHVPPMGSQMAQEVMQRLDVDPTEANTPTGRLAQGALGGTVAAVTLGTPAGAAYRGAGAVPTAVRSAQLGLASGVGSELAGEATRGTQWEIPARLAAGILLPTAAALEQSRMGGTMRIMGRAVDDATPAQLRQAQQLLDDARAGGHPLTVPEAMAQAGVPGATRLLIMQRLAEQQGAGAGQTLNTFRQFQAQNAERAINDIANQVAPPIALPRVVGADVGLANQRAAEGVVRQAERARTEASGRAGYTAADPQPLTPADVQPLLDRIRIERDRAGGVARTGSLYTELNALHDQIVREASMPDFSIRRLDNIYKQMQDRLEDTRNATTQLSRGDRAVLTPIVQSIRDDVLHLNPDYLAGSQRYAQISPGVERLSGGLPGAIAATPDPQTQLRAILGPNTRPDEVAQTVTAMRTAPPPLGGPANPQAVNDLVRMRIDDALGGVSRFQGLVPREQLGARFNVLMRNDPRAAENFEAALRTVPNGTATLDQLNRLLDVFEAQGRRLNIGSPTDVNAVLRGALTGHLANVLPVTRIPAMIQRQIDAWSYGRRLQDIADISTSPTGLLNIRQAATERSALPRGLLAADAAAIQRALEDRRDRREGLTISGRVRPD